MDQYGSMMWRVILCLSVLHGYTFSLGTMIFCDHRISQQITEFVCKFWPKLGCVIIIMLPDINFDQDL